MSFLLSCPHCGPRDVNEFRYQGEVTNRPAPDSTLRELTDYVYFRDNVAGVQREWWYHRIGCGLWFVAERDTRTNEVVKVEVPEPAAVRVRLASQPASGSTARERSTSSSTAGSSPVMKATRSAPLSTPQARACSRGASSTTARGAFSAAPGTARTA